MKILIVHNYYQSRGGEDVAFEQHVDLLKHHGFEVETFTVSSDSIKTFRDKVKTATHLTSGHDETLTLFREAVVRFKPDWVHVHNLFPLLSPRVFDIAHEEGSKTAYTLHNFRMICANALFLRNEKPCTFCLDSKLGAIHSVLHGCYKNSHTQTLPLATMITQSKVHWNSRVDQFICLSEFSKNRFIQFGINPEKMSVLPNFAPKVNSAQYSHELPKRFAHVGRLSEEKGVLTLLDDFKKLPYELHLFGDGPLKTQIKNEKSENVMLRGQVPRESIQKELSQFHAVIIPSLCFENFPMILAESFQAGTPVIARKIGSLESWITHDLNGLLYEHSAFELVQRLAENLELRNKLSTGALDTFDSSFSETAHLKKLLEIYGK